MSRKNWDDEDYGYYCGRCDKEITEREFEAYDGLCARCRKIKTEGRRSRRKQEYFEEMEY